MRVRVVAVAFAVLVGAVFVPGSGAGAGTTRQTSPLITTAGLGCRGRIGAAATRAVVGSVKYTQDGNELDVSLKLSAGQPNAVYDVSIAEVGPTGCLNLLPGGRLFTDESGRDDNQPLVILDSGVTHFFAVARASCDGQAGCDKNVYRTDLIPVAPVQINAKDAGDDTPPPTTPPAVAPTEPAATVDATDNFTDASDQLDATSTAPAAPATVPAAATPVTVGDQSVDSFPA